MVGVRAGTGVGVRMGVVVVVPVGLGVGRTAQVGLSEPQGLSLAGAIRPLMPWAA